MVNWTPLHALNQRIIIALIVERRLPTNSFAVGNTRLPKKTITGVRTKTTQEERSPSEVRALLLQRFVHFL